VVTDLARLGVSGAAKGHAYELTEIQLPHVAQRGGRRLYQDWRQGQDFTLRRRPSTTRKAATDAQNPVTKSRTPLSRKP
jgi:hypothetical protein